jgi:hypothetical protein
MPAIPATQEVEIRRIKFQSQPRQIVRETLSWKTHHKNRVGGWLKVKALSSSPSTAKKNPNYQTNILTLLRLGNSLLPQVKKVSRSTCAFLVEGQVKVTLLKERFLLGSELLLLPLNHYRVGSHGVF